MNTLRDILNIVLPCAILALGLVILFYVGLIRRWWW